MDTAFSDINIIDFDQEHMLGRIHSMITGSAVDGPGMRFVMFLQGCLFRCQYCHNRDSWDLKKGDLYTVAELVEQILPYAEFLEASKGGVTVSGGEPLLQPEFLMMLMRQLKIFGIHTCIDTNGYVSNPIYGELLDSILENTDLVLLDIKQINDEKHKVLVEVSNERTLRFAEHLASVDQAVWLRYVVVPGHSDDLDDVRALARFIQPMKNIQRIDLLPYHLMGEHKWQELGYNYPLKGLQPPSAQVMANIRHVFTDEFGLSALCP